MTDPSPAPAAFPDDGLIVVPTLAGFQHLVERVEELEAGVPATVPGDEAEPITLAGLSARLDRHRAELEDIKSRWNDLLKYLGLVPAAAPAAPATTPESYQ